MKETDKFRIIKHTNIKNGNVYYHLEYLKKSLFRSKWKTYYRWNIDTGKEWLEFNTKKEAEDYIKNKTLHYYNYCSKFWKSEVCE